MLKASLIALAIVTTGAGLVMAEEKVVTNPPATGAPAQMLTTLPEHVSAVSNWYDQNVYDPSENKLGEIKDMLLDNSGKVTAVIISVGGFLGMNEKDVAAPFDAISFTKRDNKIMLVMNASKDTLNNARGFKYDRQQGTWTMAEK